MPLTGAHDLTESEYRSDPWRWHGGSVNYSTLKKVLPPSCPRLALHAAENPEYKDAYDLGTVTHKLVLGAGPDLVEIPEDSWRTKAAKDARDQARAEGKVALLSHDMRKAQAMRQAVHNDSVARWLLTRPGTPEQTLLWREPDGTRCRALGDYVPDPCEDPTMVDVKTVSGSMDDESLARLVLKFGYHLQADFYERGYKAVHGVLPDFAFVMVSTEAPYIVRVVLLSEPFMADAKIKVDRALEIGNECKANDNWPSYPNDLQPLAAPRWADLEGRF